MPRIFIVDDSISVRKALEITFKRHELDSASAVSAEQALEVLHDTPARFDLLMLDVIMPGMSGLELCLALRQQAAYHHLPIILMSGNVDDEIRHQAREVGANGVLRKPFSPDELIPMVQHFLNAQPAAPEPVRPEPAVTEAAATEPVLPVPEAVAEVPAPEAPHAAEPTTTTAPHTPEAPASAAPVAAVAAVPAEAAAVTAPAPAAPVAPAAPEAPASDPLLPLKLLTKHYAETPLTEDLLVLNPEGQAVYHSGSGLPAHLASYARYFATAGGVIGQQLLHEDLQSVTLSYPQHVLQIHAQHGFLLLALTRVNPPA